MHFESGHVNGRRRQSEYVKAKSTKAIGGGTETWEQESTKEYKSNRGEMRLEAKHHGEVCNPSGGKRKGKVREAKWNKSAGE